jgi:biopolymer transport protein ExbB
VIPAANMFTSMFTSGRRVALITAAALLSVQLAVPMNASAAAAAVTLDQLLQQVKNTREAEAQQNAQRLKEFTANRAQQASALAEAERTQAAADARSKALSTEFDNNEKEINEVTTLLKQREGNLGELFGVTRQVAGDTANVMEQSIISAQFPDREEFLRSLASAKTLPSIAELERLWFEMQREMTATGDVQRFEHPVVQADGQTATAPVVRIGPFTIMSNGKFLSYLPSLRSLAVLTRQPPGQFLSAAQDLQDATSGFVRAVVDPGRGVLIALYGERPDIAERIEQGEEVGYVIIAVGLIGFACFVYQFIYLIRMRVKVAAQQKDLNNPKNDNPLGRVLLAFKGDASRIEEDYEIAELRISEAIVAEIPKIERFQAFLRLAVAAGPLLGLIGTVIGMILTFQSITESGSSDPKLMAHGISQAMIATVLGLGIAIPLLFCNAMLSSISRQIESLLDGQASGLLAEMIEKRNAR